MSDTLPVYLGPDDLASLDLTVEDMRRCHGATELTGQDGRPCWSRGDVLAALKKGGEGA
jgi:hypothetical protein